MDIPEKMIDASAERMVQEFAQQMQMQGITFDQYLQMTGSTMDQMKEQVRPQAQARVETSLVLEAIVEAEKIEASDDELKEELEKMSKMYNMEVEKIEAMLGDEDKENIKKDICTRKAAELVVAESK